MSSRTTSTSFLLRGEETIEGFLGENADTFRTVCQIALTKNLSLNTDNIKQFCDEFTQSFKRKLIDAATENDKRTLIAFIDEFLLPPEENINDSSSNESSDCSGDDTSMHNDTDNGILDLSKEQKSECGETAAFEDESGTHVLENTEIKWLNIPAAAVTENRKDIIKICISAGWDLNLFRDLENRTLISQALAAANQSCELIILLLKHIDVNIPADKGMTPLHVCMSNQSLNCKEKFELLQILIADGADCRLMDELVGSPLHSFTFALQFSHTKEKTEFARDIIQTLVQNGSDLNGVDWFGNSILSNIISTIPNVEGPFAEAQSTEEGLEIRKIKVDLVTFLLQIGSDPNQKDKKGRTSLHVAMISRNPDVVEILVRYGADVNSVSNTGSTPVYYFCHQSQWEDTEESIDEVFLPIVGILHDAKANMNIKAVDKSTVLHFAAARLNETSCSTLIEFGACLDVRDYLLRTPLHMAARNKLHPGVCETLINAGGEIDVRDINKTSPLHTACLFENAEAVRILLENKSDVSAKDELGIQPIHIAAENGDETIIQYLLDYGADIQAEDEWKATPLHYSASDGNSETTKALLSRGADKHRLDQRGRKPIDLARFRGHFEISNLLKDEDAEVIFGNFAPNLFPNRKLVKPGHVDDYFENVTQDVRSMGRTTTEIAEAILCSPGVGRVNLHNGENKEISDTINKLVKDIVDRVGELDPIFKCKLLNAGSTAERVKIGYPDEFDFVCNLEEFSSIIKHVEKDDVPFYAKILLKTPVPEPYARFCVRTSDHLNGATILRYFHCLVRQAMFDVLTKGYKNIYAGLLLLHHHESIFDETAIGLSKLQGLGFTWRGGDHKLLDISIDLNPVVFTHQWPEMASMHSPLLKDIPEYGIYLIPKQCRTNIMAFPLGEASSAISDLWRYSTHHIEATVMKSVPQAARDCYMLCKAFRMEPLTCAVELEPDIPWYSEAQLQALDSDEAGSIETEVTESFVTDIDIRMDNVQSNVGTAEVNLMYEEDDKFGENVFYQDENELTAESSIPSYYIKTIFLTEADEIFKESGEFPDDINIWDITRRVYEKLCEAVEAEHLTSPFFPSQEIYSSPNHENAQAAKKLRQSFCQNILKLLRRIEQMVIDKNDKHGYSAC